MKISLESTTKIVELVANGGTVPARIWEGVTDGGIAVHAFITRIAALETDNLTDFERELQSHKAPSPVIDVYPLRMIL